MVGTGTQSIHTCVCSSTSNEEYTLTTETDVSTLYATGITLNYLD